MTRTPLVVLLAAVVAIEGCNAIAALAAPKIKSVTVDAPSGLLVGESAQAVFHALGDDGRDHQGRPVKWTSSDPASLSIDAQGKMLALIAGRTVTITAEVDGKRGSAVVVVANNDTRFAYALADQPTAAGPYVPDAATRYNSGGGTIEITRSGTGVYSVRFAGMGRTPGQRDNVQVSAVNATVAAYCKADVWQTVGADLRVPVSCFGADATPVDSKFTIMALGAWAIGKTEPIGFLLSVGGTGPMFLDSAATSRNSSGGHVAIGYNSEGNVSVNFEGLQPAGPRLPAAMTISAVGLTPRHCHIIAIDASIPGFGIFCNQPGGALGDSPFSLLWMQHGRPSMRFGFASPQNISQTTAYSPDPGFLINSSGAAVSARKTSTGHYRVIFAGLARQAGATETVLVSSFLFIPDRVCDVVSWGNSGTTDLFVDVACADPSGAPVDARFSVMVIE